jgi:hypothetical protein
MTKLLPVSAKAMQLFLRAALPALVAVGFAAPLFASTDTFIKPTPEELAMTSLPGYPGAPAVVLYREEINNDDLHEVTHYQRIKILTEDGKKYADVQLRFANFVDDNMEGAQTSIDSISGRTIHADGSIVPFTGKPYLKTVEKNEQVTLSRMGQSSVNGGLTFQEQVFTLPDVEVGSIIEYRYATRWNENWFEPPFWYLQGSLYVKSAFYAWYPTLRHVNTGGQSVNINWFKILPGGTDLKQIAPPGGSGSGLHGSYELKVHDIPPLPQEDMMPPLQSISFRVLFNYTPYASLNDYWKSEGRDWFKSADAFIGHDSSIATATQTITAGASTSEEKLRKIYAAVMKLDNTRYNREHNRREDKAAGLSKVDHAADIYAHKRGNASEITELFVAMARAAGFKAYLMLVPDRSERQFNAGWASFEQFDDLLAIVNVDGQEVYLDPGSRYCSYGHLDWRNSSVEGLRATDKDPAIAPTPIDGYGDNTTVRVANLTMDEQGIVQGTVNLRYSGAQATHYRQEALRGDEESLRHALRTSLETMLPRTLEVTVKELKGLDAYEEPLVVDFDVKGQLAVSAGKRFVAPVDLFSARDKAMFPGVKRETPVYFNYPRMVRDAVRINLPKDLAIEAAPASSTVELKGAGAYTMSITSAADNITVRRDYVFGAVIVPNSNYEALRTFFSNLEAKDQETVVLKDANAAGSSSAGN